MRLKYLMRLLMGLLMLAVLSAACVGISWWQWLHTEQAVPKAQRVIEVVRGESVAQVARRLAAEGLLSKPKIWRHYARFIEPEPIRVGEYQLPASISPVELLHTLQSGEVIHYSVTLVEGRTFAELVQHLAVAERLQSRLLGLSQEEQLAKLNLEIDHPEGWFYPDTYSYVAGDTDVELLRRAHRRMQTVLASEWQSRAPDLPYETPYEALIMASIIERETGVPYERPTIAGVFVRRLQKGMRLQTDPTVIYGMGDAYQGRITRAHLRAPTPYNTYTIHGLPPTPIAMPGGHAIYAALNPEDGDTLYFVARGDGSHHFSVTLEEHNRAVNRYQRNRVEGYRSSPLPAVPQE